MGYKSTRVRQHERCSRTFIRKGEQCILLFYVLAELGKNGFESPSIHPNFSVPGMSFIPRKKLEAVGVLV